jgi:hypothetical protein
LATVRIRSHIARRALGSGVAVLLLAPGAARAADLTVQGTCFASGQPIVVSGTAFTPGAPVTITGGAAGGAQADAIGAFTAQVTATPIAELGPRPVTITAVDRVNPANTATVQLRIVREAFASNLPLAGLPDDVTTWRFAGFMPDRPVYGHFVLRGRSHGDHRFGLATGACGTLTVRARRIPGVRGLRPGRWTLKLDQRMSYREATPGSAVTFRIARRGG